MESTYACLLYNQEGFYCALWSTDLTQLYQKITVRSTQIKGCVLCTLPYMCTIYQLDGMYLPDVSLPEEWKPEFFKFEPKDKDV